MYNIMGDVPIYKIYKLVGIDRIDKIYIFNSNFKEYEESELMNMFNENPMGDIFSNTFNSYEIDQIKKNDIKLEFISENIYPDDSIGIIKLKIFDALGRKVSTDEIYLFSLIKDIINSISSYQILTQNNQLLLSKIRLEQLLLNIYTTDKELFNFELPDKDEYLHDDILNLNLEDKEYYLSQPLGQKIVFSSNYPFISNPYLVKEYDTLLENSRNELSSMNNNLLLDTPTIIDNSIYICLAEDVFNYNEEQGISTDYSCKIYFPFLYKNDIKSLDDLSENKNKLIQASLNKMDLNLKRYLKNIDLFYEIYKTRTPSKNFNQIIKKTGINYFKIVVYPEYDIVIPVDIIFKIIHSTKNNPLIKFNPSFKQDNIYRLYADEVSSDGKKIPHLSIAKINDLKQKIGKTKSVSIYTLITHNQTNYEMVFEIDTNSHIMIYPFRVLDSPILFDLNKNIFENIDEIISLAFEPVIQKIKHIFEQSGITLPTFASISSKNVEIRELKYQTVYNITKPFNLNKYKTCVSTIFNFEKNVGNEKYELRFKRVSNFNKYTNQEAYVMEQLEEGASFEDIQQGLLENYEDLNEEDAIDIISKIIKYIELTRGSKRKRNLIIRNNPGFPSTFKFNKHDGTLTIDIEKINNIYYLNTLRIYLDSVIRIVEDENSLGQNIKMCTDSYKINDINFEEINSRSEEGILSNQVPDIVDEKIIYGDYREVRDEETNINDIVDMFNDLEGSDVESDDSFELTGGMDSDENIIRNKFQIPKIDLAPSKKNIIMLNGKQYVKIPVNKLKNIIGFAIAKSYSKYMNIIKELINELKEINFADKNKVVKMLTEMLDDLRLKYNITVNKFLLIEGSREETTFKNYNISDIRELDDSQYTYDIDPDKNKYIFKDYNKKINIPLEWIQELKDKIDEVIDLNSDNIDNLIEIYRTNKNKKNIVNLDRKNYNIIFDDDIDDNDSSGEDSSNEISSDNSDEDEDEEVKPAFQLKKKEAPIKPINEENGTDEEIVVLDDDIEFQDDSPSDEEEGEEENEDVEIPDDSQSDEEEGDEEVKIPDDSPSDEEEGEEEVKMPDDSPSDEEEEVKIPDDSPSDEEEEWDEDAEIPDDSSEKEFVFETKKNPGVIKFGSDEEIKFDVDEEENKNVQDSDSDLEELVFEENEKPQNVIKFDSDSDSEEEGEKEIVFDKTPDDSESEEFVFEENPSIINRSKQKQPKRVSIVIPRKSELLELIMNKIGYNIVGVFSKYALILSNIIDKVSNSEIDEEQIDKIISKFEPMIEKLKDEEKKYKNKYAELGGNISDLDIDNYDNIQMTDTKFDLTIDDDNKMHLMFNNKELKLLKWLNSVVAKMNRKIERNEEYLGKLIDKYKEVEKKTESEISDDFMMGRMSDESDNLSEISDADSDEEKEFVFETKNPDVIDADSDEEEEKEFVFEMKAPLEKEKEELELVFDESDDESMDEDLNILLEKEQAEQKEQLEEEEEKKKQLLIEDQPLINVFADVDISKINPDVVYSSSSSDTESTLPDESLSDEDDAIEIIEGEDQEQEQNIELEDGLKQGDEEMKEIEEEEEEEINMSVVDPTGMKLIGPNYFTERLKNKASEIFDKSKLDNFDYTRSCNMTSTERRQPVILTKKEKEAIMKEYGEDLNEENDFMKYSSDPTDESKTFYYMCPRFWCLKTNKMVTEKDILDGKCGPKVDRIEDAIIPPDSKTVPKNRFVYEFISKNNKKQFPGFHSQKRKIIDEKTGKERDVCVPCCFNILNSALKRRKECSADSKNILNENMTINERKIQDNLIIQSIKDKDDKYIKDGTSYGLKLPEYRRGMLPDVAQRFLHEVTSDCIEKNNLKLNKKCLLRIGVEHSEKKSFIACMANYIFYKKKYYNMKTKKYEPLITKYFPDSEQNEVPRVRQMIEIIIKSIKIDNYIKYQNGDLVNIFYSPDVTVDKNVEKSYHKSKLYNQYKRTFENKKNAGEMDEKEINKKRKIKDFFNKVVNSLENFKKFLRNDKSYVDYTYLWDIICMPNKRLMNYGINMVILNISNIDMTNNIELICPTNHYQSHMYNSRKKTIIIIKHENIFEPVYLFERTLNRLEIVKYFTEYDRKLTKTLRSVFAKIIKPMLKDKCVPLSVYPKSKYRFKQPILLDELIKKLKKRDYIIKKQILNYEGKVIGVIAYDYELATEGYIPCYPSALTSLTKEDVEPDCIDDNSCDYEFAYMDDISWSQDYYTTLFFLQKYYELYDEEQIKIKPISCQDDEINGFCRVVEDGVVSGFLTDSNQFIPIKEPIIKQETNELNIVDIEYNSTYEVDSDILISKSGDSNRAKFVKRVELETNYYNIFRNVIRILLNDYKNLNERRLISSECNNKTKSYLNKLKTVEELLRNLTDEHITFLSEDEGYNVDDIQIDKLKNCITDDVNKCGKNPGVCAVMNNDKCGLIIPKNNLVTGKDNEQMYFSKISDELIRYNRISSFIFKPNSFLSFMKIKYKINSDEIILLESMITQEYFRELKSIGINKYRMGKTYDTANPLITYNTYSNMEILDDTLNPDYNKKYTISEPTKIYNKHPRELFPPNYKEITYSGTHDCGLYLIINLLAKFKGEKMTISNIKELLLERYNYYTKNQDDKSKTIGLISILNEEGQIDTNQLQDKTMTFRELIMSEGFIPTNFDLWILLTTLEIPSLFISIKFIAETRFNKKEFATYYTDETTKMAVIIIPASFQRKRGVYPMYKLILNESNNEKIDVNVIKSSENLNDAIENKITINKYLQEIFNKDNKTKYKGRKPGKRAFDELLDKEIALKSRDKEDDYGISYKPGEYANRLKELGISEPESEEYVFKKNIKPKKSSNEDYTVEESVYGSETSMSNKREEQKEQEEQEEQKESEEEEEMVFSIPDKKIPKNITKKIVENIKPQTKKNIINKNVTNVTKNVSKTRKTRKNRKVEEKEDEEEEAEMQF